MRKSQDERATIKICYCTVEGACDRPPVFLVQHPNEETPRRVCADHLGRELLIAGHDAVVIRDRDDSERGPVGRH